MSISVCGNLVFSWKEEIPISLDKENDLSEYVKKQFHSIEELEAYIDSTPKERRREHIYIQDSHNPRVCSQHQLICEYTKDAPVIDWVINFVEDYYVKLDKNVRYAHIPTLTVYETKESLAENKMTCTKHWFDKPLSMEAPYEGLPRLTTQIKTKKENDNENN
jgi:hypothetical protein